MRNQLRPGQARKARDDEHRVGRTRGGLVAAAGLFLDPLCGGAWPLLVGGVICLVDSVNERDLDP